LHFNVYLSSKVSFPRSERKRKATNESKKNADFQRADFFGDLRARFYERNQFEKQLEMLFEQLRDWNVRFDFFSIQN